MEYIRQLVRRFTSHPMEDYFDRALLLPLVLFVVACLVLNIMTRFSGIFQSIISVFPR